MAIQDNIFAISLHAQRLSNQAKTLLRQLDEVQAKRRALQQNKLDEAVRAYRFKQMMGETFNPAENGFVFSLEQIRLASRGCGTASGRKIPVE